MNLGIVSKVVFEKEFESSFNKVFQNGNHDYQYDTPNSVLKYNCLLYVDFINKDGKLERVMFQNEYFYHDGEIVELAYQDDKIMIIRKTTPEELNNQTEALKVLLEKEILMLEEERAIIKEQFGELESEIYDYERENIINILKTLVDQSITKGFRSKLMALAKELVNKSDEWTADQRDRCTLLICHIITNFEQINRQLSLSGEEPLDSQLIRDLYDIVREVPIKRIHRVLEFYVSEEMDRFGVTYGYTKYPSIPDINYYKNKYGSSR